jgi:ribose transport system substrate-binding protein
MSDTKAEAYQAATKLIQAIGGKGTIVHLAGQVVDVATKNRIAGVNQAVQEHPGVTLLETLTDVDTAEAAQSAVSNLLSAKASQIDGIVATGDWPSISWTNAATQRNETRIKSVLIDNDPIVLAGVKAGYVYATAATSAYMQAYIGMLSLKLLVDGCKWKDPSNLVVDAPYLWVDASNLAGLDAAQQTRTWDMAKTWKDKYWTCP